ncbi:MAG: ATP-dependent helicase, partial [Bifidobacteriaceae bacterium]|nr:ATP-dependent helicase [Bifidobacteriaceae bacterium]
MSISVKSILANLDSEQIKAVKTLDGPLYILAGAGAGKTRTITHRIAYAVKSNYWSVNSILATTFTVKAALEMKDRLEKLEVSGVTVNTFHGVALEILKTNWQIITSAPFPELMDNRLSFLESICKSNSYNLSNIQIMAISDEISWMKTSLVPVEQYKESLSWNNHEALDFINTEEFLYIFDCYETIKSQNNRIDFEDILLIMAHGIERYPQLDNKVRGRYRHF